MLIAAVLLAAASLAAAPPAREDEVLIMGNPAGKQTIGGSPADSAEYSYNDRGRGDHITAHWKLDPNGIPLEYSGSGNDYMKAPVQETFRLDDGTGTWSSGDEHGSAPARGATFYVPLHAPPEIYGVLARALLKAPGHQLKLLPAGEARIEQAGSREIDADGKKVTLTQYHVFGLGWLPLTIWLDAEGNTAAQVSSWFTIVQSRYAAAVPQLLAADQAADTAWAARFAQQATHVPKGALVIRNARLFDPRDGSVTPATSVLIRGERIVRVAPDAELKAPADSETIDAHGRFLMPGLWDNHQHFGDADGTLDLMAGVTSARDMANDTDGFLKRVARFDAGTELGPRVLKAGIIDGTGEFAGPTKMRVDTADEAIKDVDWYADHGYAQIKIYSSVKPELVPVIADRAHARGLRVSGHVPAFMSAQQFVEGGADEIQHLNFIELNFLWPEVQETRNRDRFIKVAEHAREFTPDDPKVREFIAFLKRHHTVLDPTMGVFEGLFAGDPHAVTPGLEHVAPRFPPQIQREMRSGALEAPADKKDAYAQAFPAMLNLLKALHDAGVTIVPGTDSLAGFMLHHELELYARAGIPNAEVLRMATLTPAQVMGVDKDLGLIAPGKLADMILIDGDPLADMHAIEHVDTVIKGGKVYDPAQLEKAFGIAPRKAR